MLMKTLKFKDNVQKIAWEMFCIEFSTHIYNMYICTYLRTCRYMKFVLKTSWSKFQIALLNRTWEYQCDSSYSNYNTSSVRMRNMCGKTSNLRFKSCNFHAINEIERTDSFLELFRYEKFHPTGSHWTWIRFSSDFNNFTTFMILA